MVAVTKRIVSYDRTKGIFIGHYIDGAHLWPTNHPDAERVSNNSFVRTSGVVSFDAQSGRLETQNTVYLPQQ